jgi:hypothetical protein
VIICLECGASEHLIFNTCKRCVSYSDLGHITCTFMIACSAMAALFYHARLVYDCNHEVRHLVCVYCITLMDVDTNLVIT